MRDLKHLCVISQYGKDRYQINKPGEFNDAEAREHKFISKADCEARSKAITDVNYTLALALLRGGKTFHGDVKIAFTLKEVPADGLFVDYKGKMVLRLVVNGTRVMKGNPFRDHRVYFDKDLLKVGSNEVEIRFESNYVRDNQGVHYY
jgi:hypothetical protein